METWKSYSHFCVKYAIGIIYTDGSSFKFEIFYSKQGEKVIYRGKYSYSSEEKAEEVGKIVAGKLEEMKFVKEEPDLKDTEKEGSKETPQESLGKEEPIPGTYPGSAEF